MADRNANKIALVGATFQAKEEIVVATYDFAEDGGATADDIILLNPSVNCAVRLMYINCETAFTSGGSATIIVGVNGVGSENQFLTSTAYTAMTGIVSATGNAYVEVTAAQDVLMRIGTAALTAGKAHFFFKVHSRSNN